jgi:hypothetical protein
MSFGEDFGFVVDDCEFGTIKNNQPQTDDFSFEMEIEQQELLQTIEHFLSENESSHSESNSEYDSDSMDSQPNKKRKGLTSVLSKKNHNFISNPWTFEDEKKVEIKKETKPVTFEDKHIPQNSQINSYKSYCGEKFVEGGTSNVKYCGAFHQSYEGYCRNMARFKCIECGYEDSYNKMLKDHPHFVISSHKWEFESKVLFLKFGKFPAPKKIFFLKIKQDEDLIINLTYPKTEKSRSKIIEIGFVSVIVKNGSRVELICECSDTKGEIKDASVHPTFIDF